MTERDRHYLVEDAGSTNGTFVNRERLVAPVVLQTGDRVQIDIARELFDATVTIGPLFDPTGERMRPAS